MEQLPVLGDTPAEDVLELTDAIEPPPAIGTDERRMHVRAYNHWVSLLRGRQFPSSEDIDPETNADFGPHSVLLDFTRGAETPSISYLGDALVAECGLTAEDLELADVPPRSLLSRLTDHYMQIIANRAPVGFEAEFVSAGGKQTAYRGILMPFSSDDDTIDFIFGVINWKEVAPLAEAQAVLDELATRPPVEEPTPRVPAWQDGPHSPVAAPTAEPELILDVEAEPESEAVGPDADGALADWLAHAREGADAVKHADSRSRVALYRALGLAYDFALAADARPDEFAELLLDAGIKVQNRAPMTPVVKLVFGADYDKTRLTEFASALTFGRKNGLLKGGMAIFLEHYPGGLKAIVNAERRDRRPAKGEAKPDVTREAARRIATQAVLNLPGDDEFVVLVARRVDAERVAIIGAAPEDRPLIDRALRHVVAAENNATAG